MPVPQVEIIVRVLRRGIAVVLAGHRDRRSVRTAGERQQHHRSNTIETDATLHARKNASSFFNVESTLALWEFVKDKDLSFSYKLDHFLHSRITPQVRKFGT